MRVLSIADPAEEPLSLSEAKHQLQLLDSEVDDHELISSLVASGREFCEEYTHRLFVERQVVVGLPTFSSVINLPHAPVSAITSIYYLDSDGVDTLLAADQYELFSDKDEAFLAPAYGLSWPSCRVRENSVRITYTAGLAADAATVPQRVKTAIKLYLADLYNNREENVIGVSVSPNVSLGITRHLATLVHFK